MLKGRMELMRGKYMSLKYRAIDTIQSEQQREKKFWKKMKRASETHGTISEISNIHVCRVPEKRIRLVQKNIRSKLHNFIEGNKFTNSTSSVGLSQRKQLSNIPKFLWKTKTKMS